MPAPPHIPKAMRLRVLARYGGKCAYCGAPNPRTIDHIVAKADRRRAGIDDLDETYLVPACLGDNVLKGTRRLVPPSWAEKVDALNSFFGGVEFRVWRGSVQEPAYAEVWK